VLVHRPRTWSLNQWGGVSSAASLARRHTSVRGGDGRAQAGPVVGTKHGHALCVLACLPACLHVPHAGARTCWRAGTRATAATALAMVVQDLGVAAHGSGGEPVCMGSPRGRTQAGGRAPNQPLGLVLVAHDHTLL